MDLKIEVPLLSIQWQDHYLSNSIWYIAVVALAAAALVMFDPFSD